MPSKKAYIFAGIPEQIYNEVESSVQKHEPFGNPLILGSPILKLEKLEYREGYVEKILGKIKNKVHEFEMGILFYVNFPNTNHILLERLFPSFLSAKLDISSYSVEEGRPLSPRSEKKKGEIKNAILGATKVLVKKIDACIGPIERVLEQPNSQPFLLPVKNFDEVAMKSLLGPIINFDTSDILTDRILPTKHKFENLFPREIADSDDGKKYYKNDKDLFFKPAEIRQLHGNKRTTDCECGAACLIKSYFRLGRTYRRGFHYDVQYKKPRRISSDFESCHGQKFHAKNATHINIHSNDFVDKP